jgi:hypothetical protein
MPAFTPTNGVPAGLIPFKGERQLSTAQYVAPVSAYVRSKSSIVLGFGGSSATIAWTQSQLPNGYQSGDLLIAIVAANDNGFNAGSALAYGTTPTGWTLSSTFPSSDFGLNVYTRTATGSAADAFSVLVNFDASGSGSLATAVMLAVANAGTPTFGPALTTSPVNTTALGSTGSLLLVAAMSYNYTTRTIGSALADVVAYSDGNTNSNYLYVGSQVQDAPATHQVVSTGFQAAVAIAIPYQVASTSNSASANLISTPTPTATGAPTLNATAALTSTPTPAATGSSGNNGTANLISTFTPAATGALVLSATAALTTTATPAATGTPTYVSSATLTSTPTPAATGVAVQSASAALTTTPTPTATGVPTLVGSAALTTTPVPTATSSLILSASASLTTTMTLSASATSGNAGVANLVSTPTPVATAVPTLVASASLTSTFTPAATATSVQIATAALTSTFTPSATGTPTYAASATLTSTFTPSATGIPSGISQSATASLTVTPLTSALPLLRTPTKYLFKGSANVIRGRVWGGGDVVQYSVIKKGNVYTESPYPTSADYSTADVVYRGGYVHEVTADEAARLQAAGYTINYQY